MSYNAVLTDRKDEQVLPITTAENVFYSESKTVKQVIDDIIGRGVSGGINISYGNLLPTGGNDGDVYFQIDYDTNSYGKVSYEKVPGEWMHNDSVTKNDEAYNLVMGGNCRNNYDIIMYKISNLIPNNTYTFSFEAQIDNPGGYLHEGSFSYGVNFKTTNDFAIINHGNIERGSWDSTKKYQSFFEDSEKHNYSFSFVAESSVMYMLFSFHDIQDGYDFTLTVSNFVAVTNSGDDENPSNIVDIWLNVDGDWITEIDSGGSSASDDYSTTETRIGTWIDGKPLYRKVITGTIVHTSDQGSGMYSYDYSHGIQNIETAVRIDGYVVTSSGTDIPIGYYTTWNNQFVSAYFTAVNLAFRYCTSFDNRPYVAILEYTKTTD